MDAMAGSGAAAGQQGIMANRKPSMTGKLARPVGTRDAGVIRKRDDARHYMAA